MQVDHKDEALPSRRRVILMGAAGAAALVGLNTRGTARADTASSTILTPEETEGPFWIDERLKRADIRLDPASKTFQKGLPLTLNIKVSQLKNGVISPLSGAYVDLWHCNAMGEYSDVQGTTGQKFLRGYQVTDSKGQVQFTTIYPGWYQGRTVHIHARVRTIEGAKTTHDFTTQFYFDEAVTTHVYKQAPYSAKLGRDMFNKTDGIYRSPVRAGSATHAGGELLMLKLVEDSQHAVATFDMLLDVANLPARSRGGGPGGPGGPGGRGFGGPGGPGGPDGPGGPPPDRP